jgi:hypothetical protein
MLPNNEKRDDGVNGVKKVLHGLKLLNYDAIGSFLPPPLEEDRYYHLPKNVPKIGRWLFNLTQQGFQAHYRTSSAAW